MAELRKDPLSGNWIVVGHKIVPLDPHGPCPFCPGNEYLTPPTIRQTTGADGTWKVRCFSALNSVFRIETEESKRAEGLYDKMGNVGAHEIIADHRDHHRTLATFSVMDLTNLLDMYIDRIVDLKKDKRFKNVAVFRNQGELAGSFISHPHSHVLATPIPSKRIDLEVANARSHFLRKERCLYCDILRQEIRQNKRIVSINDNFVSFCPFASRFPFETWVFPRFHSADFENLRDSAIKTNLASILIDTIGRLEKNVPAYSLLIHTSPNVSPAARNVGEIPLRDIFHWHIEILPKVMIVAKYRTEDEFYVIPDTPEEAAAILRGQ